jgi:predicted RNA-binding protein YlxR (DUF448 family)
VRRPDGSIGVDRTGKAPGRGAYIHTEKDCLEVARKRRALERALGVPIPPEIWAELRPEDASADLRRPGGRLRA